MLLTQTDIINMKVTAESRLNTSDIIKSLIKDDVASAQKKNMQSGEKYYLGEQDIYEKDFRKEILYSTDKEGNDKKEFFSNPNCSNHHNIHTFHTILVDQKAAYLVGKEPTITVDGAEKNTELKTYENLITTFADEEFNDKVHDMVIGASNKGFEFIHFYYDRSSKLKYCIVPANECIPIYDSEYENEILELVRYYNITVVKGNEKVLRKKVEWWTKNDVTYYIEDDRGYFLLDKTYPVNPMPHWFEVSSLNGVPTRKEPHSWGRVPFVILENNSRQTTDLQKIKGLIDAYDLISSQGTNDLLDLVTLYWSIQGYGGETASTIASKLRLNKAVSISDSSGSIDAKQIDLPVSGRIEWLKMLRRDIFNFGMGIDTENENFGTASGVALKFRYTQLDLKANSMLPKLKKAIREMLWFFTDDYNRMNGTNYNSDLISITINKTMITNELETVQMIVQSKGILSDKTLLEHHPFVDDANQELKELEVQRKKEQQAWESNNHNHVGGGAIEE